MDADARFHRNEAIRAALQTGERVATVAERFGLTRQMVSRIASKWHTEKATLAYGVPEEEWCSVDLALRQAYSVQKCTAKRRNIAWGFTLTTWLAVWRDSGLLPERGPMGDDNCMARHGDIGPYAPGNVSIKTNRENTAEMNVNTSSGRTAAEAMAAWVARATDGLLQG